MKCSKYHWLRPKGKVHAISHGNCKYKYKENYFWTLSSWCSCNFYRCIDGVQETMVINKGNFLLSALHREMTNLYIRRYCSHRNHNSANLCTYIKEYVYAREIWFLWEP